MTPLRRGVLRLHRRDQLRLFLRAAHAVQHHALVVAVRDVPTRPREGIRRGRGSREGLARRASRERSTARGSARGKLPPAFGTAARRVTRGLAGSPFAAAAARAAAATSAIREHHQRRPFLLLPLANHHVLHDVPRRENAPSAWPPGNGSHLSARKPSRCGTGARERRSRRAARRRFLAPHRGEASRRRRVLRGTGGAGPPSPGRTSPSYARFRVAKSRRRRVSSPGAAPWPPPPRSCPRSAARSRRSRSSRSFRRFASCASNLACVAARALARFSSAARPAGRVGCRTPSGARRTPLRHLALAVRACRGEARALLRYAFLISASVKTPGASPRTAYGSTSAIAVERRRAPRHLRVRARASRGRSANVSSWRLEGNAFSRDGGLRSVETPGRARLRVARIRRRMPTGGERAIWTSFVVRRDLTPNRAPRHTPSRELTMSAVVASFAAPHVGARRARPASAAATRAPRRLHQRQDQPAQGQKPSRRAQDRPAERQGAPRGRARPGRRQGRRLPRVQARERRRRAVRGPGQVHPRRPGGLREQDRPRQQRWWAASRAARRACGSTARTVWARIPRRRPSSGSACTAGARAATRLICPRTSGASWAGSRAGRWGQGVQRHRKHRHARRSPDHRLGAPVLLPRRSSEARAITSTRRPRGGDQRRGHRGRVGRQASLDTALTAEQQLLALQAGGGVRRARRRRKRRGGPRRRRLARAWWTPRSSRRWGRPRSRSRGRCSTCIETRRTSREKSARARV